MSSRTTKQAARAYQKTHGVPYTEALRHVVQEEAFSRFGQESETAPARDFVVGGVSTGKTIPPIPHDATQSIAYPLQQEPPKPVHLDPSQAGGVCLGSGKMPHTGLSPTTAELWWHPWQDMDQDRPATLGVYGEPGVGKTCYLAALAHQQFRTSKTLVVTPRSQGYATLSGADHIDPTLVASALDSDGAADEESQETMRRFDETLDTALADGVEVVIYDGGPQSRLAPLIRTTHSQKLVVLFTSLDVRPSLSVDHPLTEVVPDDRSVPARVTVVFDSLPAATQPEGGPGERSWAWLDGHEPVSLLRLGFPTEPRPGRRDA